MTDYATRMTDLHGFASLVLDGQFLLGGFETQGDMFQLWVATGQQTKKLHIEALTRELLKLLAEPDQSPCGECAQCTARRKRAAEALAHMTKGAHPPVARMANGELQTVQ